MAYGRIDLLSKNIKNLIDNLENFQIGNNSDEDKNRLDKLDKECRKLENDIEDIENLLLEEENEDSNFKTLLSKFDEQKIELQILKNNLQIKSNQLRDGKKKAENNVVKDVSKEDDIQSLILDSIHENVVKANKELEYVYQELKRQGE